MKVQLLSDLHLESHPDFLPTTSPQADLLVLAGDIASYRAGSLLTDSEYGLRRFSPRFGWPTPVLFLPGNHEYDGQDFDAAHASMRDICQRLDIHFLEQAVVTSSELAVTSAKALPFSPVRFIGTTLWTDFDGLNPTQDSALRLKAFRAANYHLRKAAIMRNGAPFLAEQVRGQAQACHTWLQQALQTPFEGRTVVITHHAPSLLSRDARYGLSISTAGFCNALDHLLPMANVWLHGHLHCAHDYWLNGCRVVSNPMGYAHKKEQVNFNPAFCIDLML
jgi:predicted phosphodiesterase